MGLAFVYWLVFMAVLVPGNLASALQAGRPVNWGGEAIRLLAAAALGASATPALLALARLFPVAKPRPAANLAVQAMGVAGLAVGLIMVSCLLVAWFLEGRVLPGLDEVRQQLTANSLLLIFCLALLLAVIQVVGRARPAPGPSWPAQLTIGEGGRREVIEVAAIDWIETQGNYQALHLGPETRLVRETSARLAARLDPDRFVRVHRRAIVAIDRVRRLDPLANGDAQVTLADGVELRVSRGHRQALRTRIETL